MPLAHLILNLGSLYLKVGAAVALLFAFGLVSRVEPSAAGGSALFRVLILPGAALPALSSQACSGCAARKLAANGCSSVKRASSCSRVGVGPRWSCRTRRSMAATLQVSARVL
jgi:hypothetical protein